MQTKTKKVWLGLNGDWTTGPRPPRPSLTPLHFGFSRSRHSILVRSVVWTRSNSRSRGAQCTDTLLALRCWPAAHIRVRCLACARAVRSARSARHMQFGVHASAPPIASRRRPPLSSARVPATAAGARRRPPSAAVPEPHVRRTPHLTQSCPRAASLTTPRPHEPVHEYSPSLVCTSERKSARIWLSRFCFSS